MISLKSLHKYFNKGMSNEIHVINDISLELPEKGMVAIFGKSGCGKTTLLNVIGGLDSFRSGDVQIDGQSIRQHTDEVRNREIGYIFQNYNLHKDRSCFDNVADALRLCGMSDAAEIRKRVHAALANVGMENYASRNPDTLSGGQQQRIAIARAIVKNPRIILADEPTGNLDEANTLLVMDLLKEISRDHLVLLVTHEAHLVDYYCNTVIELQDGRVVGVKQNADADGMRVRDKNDIWLGEMAHSEDSGAHATVSYFGEPTETPLQLTVVNKDGKVYLRVDTPGVKVLTDAGEVRLREGSFDETETARHRDATIDMSDLPPVQGRNFGRLFRFGASLKSGYCSNFKGQKRGKKMLTRVMGLFAAVLVVMTAIFGTAFGRIIETKESYNHNVFYVPVTVEDGQPLLTAMKEHTAGIDSVMQVPTGRLRDEEFSFNIAHFDTFSNRAFKSNGALLEWDLAKNLSLSCGAFPKADNEILLTTAVADKMLENSTVGYIDEYSDLLGLSLPLYLNSSQTFSVVGVVESKETAAYLSPRTLAQNAISRGGYYVANLADTKFTAPEGGAVLVVRWHSSDEGELPKVGDTVTINGQSVTVSRVVDVSSGYEDWLVQKGYKVLEEEAWMKNKIHEENPTIMEYSSEWWEIYNARHYEYLVYRYQYLQEWFEEWASVNRDFDSFLYFEKGFKDAMFNRYFDESYYYTLKYYETFGHYPTTNTEFEAFRKTAKEFYEIYTEYRKLYEQEYYMQNGYSSSSQVFNNNYVLVCNEADYIAMARTFGKTDARFQSLNDYDYTYATFGSKDSYGGYVLVHTTDPDATKAFLQTEYKNTVKERKNGITSGDGGMITPDDLFDDLFRSYRAGVIANVIVLVVVLAIMSVCMYFIMRSSLMSRIKEIGIYRAIGVSRKNLVFRFFVESLVLTTLAVITTFAVISAVIFFWLSSSSMMKDIFFYPPWLAGALAAVLYAVCLFCGTLPILSLLRKTPSEILAKYDI